MNFIKNNSGVIAVIALIIAIVALQLPKPAAVVQPSFGGTTNYDALTLDNGDLTLTNGNIVNSTAGKTMTLTTSNTATSTLKVGCIQMNATSSATTVRITFGPAGNATTTSQGSNSNGIVAWQFGTCPA